MHGESRPLAAVRVASLPSRSGRGRLVLLLALACLLVTLHNSVPPKHSQERTKKLVGTKKFRRLTLESLVMVKPRYLELRGSTDLPDDARLSVDVFATSNRHLGDGEVCIVRGHQFCCNLYLADYQNFQHVPDCHGEWEVLVQYFPQVYDVPSSQQPEEVVRQVGPDGENLEGPQTEPSESLDATGRLRRWKSWRKIGHFLL